jgi:hypothetical protein
MSESDASDSSVTVPELSNNKEERALPPREDELRKTVLNAIANLPPEQHVAITELYTSIDPNHTPTKIWELLTDGVTQAERGTQWGEKANHVSIGYYATEAEYNTLLLHEVGHHIFEFLDRTTLTSEQQTDAWEEDFCWRFSKTAAKIFGLPYDEQEEQLNRNFATVIQRITEAITPEGQKAAHQEYDALVAQEIAVKGYSAESPTMSFSWSKDTRPVVPTVT